MTLPPKPWTAVGAGVFCADGNLIAAFGDEGTEKEVEAQRQLALLLAAGPDAIEALELAREALAHDAPEDCWATGPKEDFAACPGCRALARIRSALADARGQVQS